MTCLKKLICLEQVFVFAFFSTRFYDDRRREQVNVMVQMLL